MKLREYMLLSLNEECQEVAQRVCKALRFGINEVQEGQELTNAERITGEVNDLVAIYEMLVTAGELPGIDAGAIEEKKLKVQKYLNYAKSIGAVDAD